MKKIIMILSIICIFCIQTQNSMELTIKDNDYTEVCIPFNPTAGVENLSENFLFDYFYNNRDNIIYNSSILGCCGYVSVAQLLMYYDTIFNDNIIADNYVIKSELDINDSWTEAPGVDSNMEIITRYENMNKGKMQNVQFINEIRTLPNSFFGKLVDCGVDQKVFSKDVLEILEIIGETTEHYADFGTDHFDRKAIIEDYFEDISFTGLNVNIITDETGNNQNSIKQQIRELIQSGYPVNLSIYDESLEWGHSVIAYFVDESGTIYCHGGYESDYFIPLDNFYKNTIVRSALYLSLSNSVHVCSGNYLSNGVGQCSHTFSCHQHILNYISTNKSNHVTNCYCGYYAIESHTFIISGAQTVCKYCGYVSTDIKVPIIIASIEDNKDEEE